MEIIFEFLFSIFGEFLLQILAELFLELGLNSLAETIKPRKERKPVFAFLGYVLLGLVAGGFSLLLFPELLLDEKSHALANIIITPIFAGMLMGWIGRLKSRRGRDAIRLDSFTYGYIFALSLALVRYAFG